jgi:hypothetical protein
MDYITDFPKNPLDKIKKPICVKKEGFSFPANATEKTQTDLNNFKC